MKPSPRFQGLTAFNKDPYRGEENKIYTNPGSMMRSKLKSLAVTAALAFAFTLAAPAGSAYAINTVSCGNQDFVELWGHDGNICFANAGDWKSYDFTGSPNCWWASKISTGNNDITFWDDHSTNPTYIPRRTIRTFPTVGWVCVGTLRIH
jgi:hypothetical protein